MPVYKYRSVEEMPPPPQRPTDLVARIRAVWNRAALLAPRLLPKGFQRFRNMDEANLARHEATLVRMRATQSRAILDREPSGALADDDT